jgi:hypothetical protein
MQAGPVIDIAAVERDSTPEAMASAVGAQPSLPGFAAVWGWLGLDSRGGRLMAGDSALTSGCLPFGEVREIVVRPHVPFRGRYLWVHAACAASFLIHSVRVGPRMAGVAPTPVPADIFAVNYGELPDVTIHDVEPGRVVRIDVFKTPADMPRGGPGWRGVPFDLPLARVGAEVAILIENIDRARYEPLRFLGGFLGEAAA